MLKKILIAMGVLVGAVVLALFAVVLLVDVNRFKPQIEQAVKENLGRTLTIDGDLSLRVFPRIAVALPKTTLSEPGSTKPFASVDSARVAVALLPLLAGRTEAGRISVDGLTATLERHADGTTNIDDLLKPQATKAPAGAGAGQRAVPRIHIGGIEISNASFTVRDAVSKNTLTLRQLNLELGRLATVSQPPLRLATQFSSARPSASGTLEVRGELAIDLEHDAFGVQSLQASVQGVLDQQPLEATLKAARLALAVDSLRISNLALAARGKLGSRDFDAQVDAPDLQVSKSAASGQRASAALKLAGDQAVQLQLALEGLSGTASDLSIAKLTLASSMEQHIDKDRQRRIVANLTSAASASLQAQTLALPQISGEVTIEDPAIPKGSAKMPVTAALTLDAKKEILDARLASKFDETALNVAAGVRGFSPPHVTFNATADRLDLDRYFPPARQAPAGGAAGGAAPDAKVDLSALRDLNLNGEAAVGQLQARGIKAQNLRVVMKAAGGRLDVAPVTASLYGGSLQAAASARADGNQLATNAALTGISIQPLLKDALDKDLLEGHGNVKLDVSTGGATVSALKRGLNGSASIALRDGAFKGVNIAARLREASALLGRGGAETQQASATEKTDFTELNATFAIKNGVASSKDLDVKSPLLRIGGAGQVDIAAGTIDYTVRASVVGTAQGQGGSELAKLRGVTVPVKLSGPLDGMRYSIDWSAAAQEALKSQAAEQLKQRVTPQVEEQRKRMEERARDALKGLLGH